MIKIGVLYGYGINCQDETEYACKVTNALVEKMHINELLNKEKNLENVHFLVLPGGFSGGDQLGAGTYFALKMKKMQNELEKFLDEGKLILGICNGFQILVSLGLLPGFNRWQQEAELLQNDCGNFQDRWIKLVINKSCKNAFLSGLEYMELPIRHGEGKFWAPQETINAIKKENLIAMQYAKNKEQIAMQEFPFNPNGSLLDIAAITNKEGTILGMMPHPEAFSNYENHPHWTLWKELEKRGVSVEKPPLGIQIFKNAVEYLRRNGFG